MEENHSKKGTEGISALIIFVALILVAAVAASVLIYTVGNLQGKSENTGEEIQQKLGTGFSVFEVTANDTSDESINASVDRISALLQLSPGSSPVKLTDVSITMVSTQGSYNFVYNSTNMFGSTTSYGVNYVKGPRIPNYISRDDTVRMNIISPINISRNSKFVLRFFPGTGNPMPVVSIIPPALTSTVTILK